MKQRYTNHAKRVHIHYIFLALSGQKGLNFANTEQNVEIDTRFTQPISKINGPNIEINNAELKLEKMR